MRALIFRLPADVRHVCSGRQGERIDVLRGREAFYRCVVRLQDTQVRVRRKRCGEVQRVVGHILSAGSSRDGQDDGCCVRIADIHFLLVHLQYRTHFRQGRSTRGQVDLVRTVRRLEDEAGVVQGLEAFHRLAVQQDIGQIRIGRFVLEVDIHLVVRRRHSVLCHNMQDVTVLALLFEGGRSDRHGLELVIGGIAYLDLTGLEREGIVVSSGLEVFVLVALDRYAVHRNTGQIDTVARLCLDLYGVLAHGTQVAILANDLYLRRIAVQLARDQGDRLTGMSCLIGDRRQERLCGLDSRRRKDHGVVLLVRIEVRDQHAVQEDAGKGIVFALRTGDVHAVSLRRHAVLCCDSHRIFNRVAGDSDRRRYFLRVLRQDSVHDNGLVGRDKIVGLGGVELIVVVAVEENSREVRIRRLGAVLPGIDFFSSRNSP